MARSVLMNFSTLVLTAFLSFFYKVVSSSAIETDDSTLILKTIVHKLPPACKQLHYTGTFNVLAASSYACLFEDKFDVKKSATILALLMQRGNEKLVGEIAKTWVSKRKWGPFNQFQIVDELLAAMSIKSSIRTSENNKKDKFEIELKSIYATVKVLVKSGNHLIVANSIYSSVAADIFNLAQKIDTEEKDFVGTVGIVLENFYSGKSGKDESKSDYKKMAEAYYIIMSLNNLAEKGKIEVNAWNIYAPVICKTLNSMYGIEFIMMEKSTDQEKLSLKRHSSASSSSSASSESSSSSSTEVSVGESDNEKGNSRVKVSKFIEISPKFVSTFASKQPESFKLKNSGGTLVGPSTSLLLITGGSVLLIAGLGYGVYWTMFKRREGEAKEFGAL